MIDDGPRDAPPPGDAPIGFMLLLPIELIATRHILQKAVLSYRGVLSEIDILAVSHTRQWPLMHTAQVAR